MFRDPDLPAPPSVFVATGPEVYNEAFMWGPRDVRREGPAVLRNVVSQNKKVPLTADRADPRVANGPAPGPDAVENLRPYRCPARDARIGFATSLPAFIYGDPPAGTTPARTRAVLHALPGQARRQPRDAGRGQPGPAGAPSAAFWQPLDWMRSTWRAVSDPTVGFDYNVTPHLVGNLADLAFDGQTAITQRGLRGSRAAPTWATRASCPTRRRATPHRSRRTPGRKREFLALAPWVVPDAPRAALRAVRPSSPPGSGDPLENDYLETAVAADLPFPPDSWRRNCISSPRGGWHGPHH